MRLGEQLTLARLPDFTLQQPDQGLIASSRRDRKSVLKPLLNMELVCAFVLSCRHHWQLTV